MSSRNLALWEELGDHLIPIMPFMDNVIARSEGSYLVDVEGNRILDLAAGQFCTILGHSHPGFTQRLIEELRNNLHTGSQYVTEGVLRAARKVAEIAPAKLKNVILLSTGSEANEFALRVAKAYTGRSGAIGFDRGYYGISLATRSLSTISEAQVDASPRIPQTFHVLAPNCARCPLRLTYPSCDIACLDLSIRMLGDNAENVAAVIVETIPSAGGMIYPTAEYFRRLHEFTRQIGALLIVDEAQTGFGRCGQWFDCENLDLSPDILVFSKTSGNGYPSAGVVISDHIQEKLLDRGFHHLSSHQNDPLAAAAVSAVIDTVRADNYLAMCRESGAYFMAQLERLASRYSHFAAVRGRGLMIACELVRDKDTLTPYAEMLMPFVLTCKARGVHITYSYHEGAIRLIPPLNISRTEIDFAISVFDSVLADLEGKGLRPDEYEQKNKVIRSTTHRGTVRRTLSRLWETSPQYWMERFSRSS
jgi:2,2-dialkylglycine decarboxylase (pyruvate)